MFLTKNQYFSLSFLPFNLPLLSLAKDQVAVLFPIPFFASHIDMVHWCGLGSVNIFDMSTEHEACLTLILITSAAELSEQMICSGVIRVL